MHAPSLHHWHPLAHSIDFVRHHQQLAGALGILLFIGLMYSIIPLPEMSQRTMMPISVAPLTQLADPANVQEYAARTAQIRISLEQLLQSIQAERVYLVVYDYVEVSALGSFDSQIFETFEATRPDIAPRLEHLRGMSRLNWLRIQQDEAFRNMYFPDLWQSYGFELENERGIAIGYIGVERRREEVPSQDWGTAQLQQTAEEVIQKLIGPLDSL